MDLGARVSVVEARKPRSGSPHRICPPSRSRPGGVRMRVRSLLRTTRKFVTRITRNFTRNARTRFGFTRNSFSAVSTLIFGSKYSCESPRRDLQNTHLCTDLRSRSASGIDVDGLVQVGDRHLVIDHAPGALPVRLKKKHDNDVG